MPAKGQLHPGYSRARIWSALPLHSVLEEKAARRAGILMTSSLPEVSTQMGEQEPRHFWGVRRPQLCMDISLRGPESESIEGSAITCDVCMHVCACVTGGRVGHSDL